MRKALGRGLDALIPSVPKPESPPPASGDSILKIPIEKIRANHLQPRKHFDPERLSALAASIREHGLAQPILVSRDDGSDTYEIIAGERRLRAAQLAGLKEIESIVRSPASEKERLSIALIENLQREDLNPIEEALGYLKLIEELGISQTELGQIIGKSKSAISNTLRLLDLPEDIQKAVRFGQITEGHARALLMIENTIEIKTVFDIIISQDLSVRESEDLARKTNGGQSLRQKILRSKQQKSADIKHLETEIQRQLGTKVEIRTRKDPTKGSITIHYFSLSDFDKIVNILKL